MQLMPPVESVLVLTIVSADIANLMMFNPAYAILISFPVV